MADAKYTEFLPDIMPLLTADPSEPLVLRAVRRAAIEFFADSWAWRYMPDPASVIAGVAGYDLDVPSGADVVVVLNAMVSDAEVENRPSIWLDANAPGWRTTTGTPRYFTQLDMDQIVLAPVPDTTIALGLTMTLVLQPSVSSTTIPRWLFNNFVFNIADGALAHLMLMPGRPWSNAKEGEDHRAAFQAAIGNARSNAVAALARAPTRVSYQH